MKYIFVGPGNACLNSIVNPFISDEFDSCDVRPTCFNGGYVSVVEGKCQCRCSPELDPDTNCTTKFGTGNQYCINESKTNCIGLSSVLVIHLNTYILQRLFKQVITIG